MNTPASLIADIPTYRREGWLSAQPGVVAIGLEHSHASAEESSHEKHQHE